jgi:hypothetical protein
MRGETLSGRWSELSSLTLIRWVSSLRGFFRSLEPVL